jgi:hypothetical protein
MRSTSFTIRSVSSQIRRVSRRSSSLADAREAAPRPGCPESGVLDLVRQHGAERGEGPRRAAMGELPVHLLGQRAFLEHHHDRAVFAERRGEDIDDVLRPRTGIREVEPVLADIRTPPPNLVHERHGREPEREDVGEALPAHDPSDTAKKCSAAWFASRMRSSAPIVRTGSGRALTTRSPDSPIMPPPSAAHPRACRAARQRGGVLGCHEFPRSRRCHRVSVSDRPIGIGREVLARMTQPHLPAVESEQAAVMLDGGFGPGCGVWLSRREAREPAATIPTSQGWPVAARPIITAAAPDAARQRLALSRHATSPFATTGRGTAATTCPIARQSAEPV